MSGLVIAGLSLFSILQTPAHIIAAKRIETGRKLLASGHSELAIKEFAEEHRMFPDSNAARIELAIA